MMDQVFSLGKGTNNTTAQRSMAAKDNTTAQRSMTAKVWSGVGKTAGDAMATFTVSTNQHVHNSFFMREKNAPRAFLKASTLYNEVTL